MGLGYAREAFNDLFAQRSRGYRCIKCGSLDVISHARMRSVLMAGLECESLDDLRGVVEMVAASLDLVCPICVEEE